MITQDLVVLYRVFLPLHSIILVAVPGCSSIILEQATLFLYKMSMGFTAKSEYWQSVLLQNDTCKIIAYTLYGSRIVMFSVAVMTISLRFESNL